MARVMIFACAAWAAAPDPGVLELNASRVELRNPSLLDDGGAESEFGDVTAGNGLPDRWRTKVQGSVRWTDAGAGVTRVEYAAKTSGAVLSRGFVAREGESFDLRVEIDPGKAEVHPVAVGLTFFDGEQTLEFAVVRIESDRPGWREVVLTASAPAGADRAAVRWFFSEGDAGGEFLFRPLVVERRRPESRRSTFDLQHVFLITIETFRHDHASVYGYRRDTTPHLARMAHEGARFDRHQVQAPFTRPSLSSMVTSRYPVSLGIVENLSRLPDSVQTVAEMFAAKGYVTAGFLAQYLLSSNFGFNQGFHEFFNERNDTPAGEVFASFMPWAEARAADNSFAWVHLFDPHGPYRPVDGYSDRYAGDVIWKHDKAQLPSGEGKTTGQFIPAYIADEGKIERRHYVARYDAEIAYVDEKVGELLSWIEAKGLSEKSIVVVTADHGESMTDHRRWFCHGSLYQHDLHVPMLVWAPGRVAAGTVVQARTTHLDIVPTLLDYAGIPAPGELRGKSLRGLLNGETASPHRYSTSVVDAGKRQRSAIVGDASLKVIVDWQGTPLEAYDLRRDPQETKDVIDDWRPVATEIAQNWKNWMAEQLADDAPREDAGRERQLSEEEAEKLRALGYAD